MGTTHKSSGTGAELQLCFFAGFIFYLYVGMFIVILGFNILEQDVSMAASGVGSFLHIVIVFEITIK